MRLPTRIPTPCPNGCGRNVSKNGYHYSFADEAQCAERASHLRVQQGLIDQRDAERKERARKWIVSQLRRENDDLRLEIARLRSPDAWQATCAQIAGRSK